MKERPDHGGGGSARSVRMADRRSKPRAPTDPSVLVSDAVHSPTSAAPAPRWSLLALRPTSPFRPPNWRSLLAAEIAGHLDPRLAARLTRWADARVLDLVRLGERPPPGHPLAEARGLLSSGRHRVRVEVEARLLAGQSDAAIAAATGVGADAVEMYHDTEFDCRSRLRYPSAVAHTFLGHSSGSGADDPVPSAWLVRRYAYLGGVHVLEELLRLLDDPAPGPVAAVDQSAASLWRAADRAACRSAVLASLLPEDPECRTTGRRLAVLRAAGGDRAGGRGWMAPLTPPDDLLPKPPAVSCERGERMGKLVGLEGESIPAGSSARATQRVRLTTGSTGDPRAARVRHLKEGRS